ncbi:hypothetical protein BH23GEM2_BH23GEM2_21810 [soil metagenome]
MMQLLRRSVRILLAGVAAATAGSCAHLAAAGAPDVRVLVYNIHAGGDAVGAVNLDRVAALIRGDGWRDAFGECGAGDGRTYPANAPARRIDYLLLSSGWHCCEAQVLESQASDHRPLLVRLAAVPH